MTTHARCAPAELFRGAAPHYARHRPGYPDTFVAHVVRRLLPCGTERVLDLGCGTGLLALRLAPFVAEVVAIDPAEEMLAVACEEADRLGVRNVRWLRGTAADLARHDVGGVDLVTMGASFHWMDAAATLDALDVVVLPHGGVVVADNVHATPPPWEAIAAELRTRLLGPARRAGAGTYVSPGDGHLEALRRSAFSQVELRSFSWWQERTLASATELQLSFSYSTSALLGAHAESFTRELAEGLRTRHGEGPYREAIETQAIIALRPGPRASAGGARGAPAGRSRAPRCTPDR